MTTLERWLAPKQPKTQPKTQPKMSALENWLTAEPKREAENPKTEPVNAGLIKAPAVVKTDITYEELKLLVAMEVAKATGAKTYAIA